MTVKEVFEAAALELEEGIELKDRNYQRAALGLQAFILILIERKSIKWEDDSFELTRIHHRVKTSPEAVRNKTNEMILDKMLEL